MRAQLGPGLWPNQAWSAWLRSSSSILHRRRPFLRQCSLCIWSSSCSNCLFCVCYLPAGAKQEAKQEPAASTRTRSTRSSKQQEKQEEVSQSSSGGKTLQMRCEWVWRLALPVAYHAQPPALGLKSAAKEAGPASPTLEKLTGHSR